MRNHLEEKKLINELDNTEGSIRSIKIPWNL